MFKIKMNLHIIKLKENNNSCKILCETTDTNVPFPCELLKWCQCIYIWKNNIKKRFLKLKLNLILTLKSNAHSLVFHAIFFPSVQQIISKTANSLYFKIWWSSAFSWQMCKSCSQEVSVLTGSYMSHDILMQLLKIWNLFFTLALEEGKLEIY